MNELRCTICNKPPPEELINQVKAFERVHGRVIYIICPKCEKKYFTHDEWVI